MHRLKTLATMTCVFVTAVLLILVIPQQLTDIQRIRAANTQLRSTHAADAPTNHDEDDTYDVSAFPSHSASSTLIAEIATHAEHTELTIDSISSRPLDMESGLLVRTEISFIAIGTFKKVRTLIAYLLDKYPALALDTLDVSRDDIASPIVAASVKLSFFSQP